MGNEDREYYKLTHPQKRIWYIAKVDEDSPLHNIGGCLNIKEKIDVDILKETINIIIKENEGLRLRLTEKDGQPFQYINNFVDEDIEFLDFSSSTRAKEDYKAWSESVFKRKYNLEKNKLYYFAIYKISEEEYGVLLNAHHIICDGWSMTLIQKQICQIYSKLEKKEEIKKEEKYSYISCIGDEDEYLKSQRFIKNKEFWNKKFKSVPEEFLYKSSNSLEGTRRIINIEESLSLNIKNYIEKKKISLNTFFIMVTSIYISKIMNKEELIIGTPIFNRNGKNQKGVVGMFTNTVPLRINIDNELKINDFIKLINKELRLSLLNQKYPYDLLIKDLELHKRGYDSLFKITVNYYNSKYTQENNSIYGTLEEYYSGNQSYSMQLTLKEWEENKITLGIDYKTAEYSADEIQTMYECIMNIIKEILSVEDINIKDINLVAEEKRNKKIYDFNLSHRDYPNKTVCKLFEEQVIKNPNKLAVEFKETKVTYKELNERANQVARYLREKGIEKGNIIGIMETHSIEILISILGILKIGAVYIPIDTSYPIERVNYMLQDSESKMVLTNINLDNTIDFEGSIINVNNLDLDIYDKGDLEENSSLEDLVYIMYTSGSTGKPKGVMVGQQGLTNYIWWAKNQYLKDENEIMPLYSSISFDLTVTSIFAPLISGNKIIIYDNDENEFVLYKILRENKVTVVKLTPAHLTLLKDSMNTQNSRIKRFIVGGDELKVSLAKEIYNSFNKNIEIYNEYGPTETVVGCMIHKYDAEKDKGISVPIGHPADNVQIYILDKYLNVVPDGVDGELYVSGDGVARGYLNRKELSKEKFINNPFIKEKKMYKTGDNARYLKSGGVEYVGRTDSQVKIRGYRIELGEIEKYLLQHENIKESIVVLEEDSRKNISLNTYIVCKEKVPEHELKKWLLKFLPKYMIPSKFIHLDSIPLTVNGKVNYSLLPKNIEAVKEFIKYKTEVEKELIIAMEEILGVESISMNDSYYQLGGDSIKAIQISSKLKNIGLEIKVKDILTYDSIEEIAATIEESKVNRKVEQGLCKGKVKKTPIIEWFFNQKFLKENSYNQYILLEWNKNIDIQNIYKAVNAIVYHHDSLRINYDREGKNLYYNKKHLSEENIVDYIDLSNYSNDEQDIKIKEVKNRLQNNFDIEKTILFKVVVCNLGNGKQSLLLIAHHLIIDAISWRIILGDFITILNQLENNKKVELPMKTNSFKEWSEELQNYSKNDFHKEKNYWNSIIEKNIEYPVDYSEKKDTVRTSEHVIRMVDEKNLSNLIKSVNEVYSLELNETLIIALVITINKIADKEDILIELERHGREEIDVNLDISRTIGWFTNIYPAYFKINNKDIDGNIKTLKEQLRNIPNKGFNYNILKYTNQNLRKESDKKNIRFNYLGDFDNIINDDSLSLSNIEFGLHSDENNHLTALMDISAMIVNRKLKIDIIYSNNRYKRDTIEVFISEYIKTINDILDFCNNKNEKEFTPSDFNVVEISQEDLDSLFE